MQPSQVFIVSEKDKNKRLDTFLHEKGLSKSRSQIKKLIDKSYVTVDRETVKAGFCLKVGQNIKVTLPTVKSIKLEKEDLNLDIVYEDSSLIVVNKPAGMVVHPAPGHRKGTLVNALLSKIKDLKPIMGELRPGIVHRLDKDTSGIIIVAKDETSMFHLAEQFRKRTVEKTYNAIVLGDFNKDVSSDMKIGRSDRDRKKMSAKRNKGREALTFFKAKERFQDFSFIEAKPKTGRTHQIRVHLANLGYPIVGDKLYLKSKMLSKIKSKELTEKVTLFERQALHAYSIKFNHPTSKESVYFKVDLPADMKELLRFLRLGRK